MGKTKGGLLRNKTGNTEQMGENNVQRKGSFSKKVNLRLRRQHRTGGPVLIKKRQSRTHLTVEEETGAQEKRGEEGSGTGGKIWGPKRRVMKRFISGQRKRVRHSLNVQCGLSYIQCGVEEKKGNWVNKKRGERVDGLCRGTGTGEKVLLKTKTGKRSKKEKSAKKGKKGNSRGEENKLRGAKKIY